MVQSKTTERPARARWTIERLLDKAEGNMKLRGLTPTAAIKKTMPDDLLAIPMDDIRVLVESALVQRLAQRRSRDRYRDTERQAEQVKRMASQALAKINEDTQKRAEVLARVTYIMHGVSTPLLTMTLEDHASKKTEAARTARSAQGRRAFHDAAIKALSAADKATIAELPLQSMLALADQAEKVWGGTE